MPAYKPEKLDVLFEKAINASDIPPPDSKIGGRIMNVKAALATILSFAAIGLLADSAIAEEVSIKGHSKTKVEGKCNEDGGVYWPTSAGGTYGCMNPDGSGIVCGGYTKEQKKTCSTFRQVPPRIPTRDEIRLGEKAKSTQAVK